MLLVFGASFKLGTYEKVYRQPHPEGISYSQTIHQTFPKSLIKNWSPTRGGRILLAIFSPNFSQKFDQKLTSDPEGSFYSIFCEKIVRDGYYP